MEAKDRTTTFLPGLPSQSHFPLPALTHLHSSYTNLGELPKPDKLGIEITGGFGKTCEFLKGQPGFWDRAMAGNHTTLFYSTWDSDIVRDPLFMIFLFNIPTRHTLVTCFTCFQGLNYFSSDIVKESPNLLLFWPILYTGAILVFLKCQFGYLRRKNPSRGLHYLQQFPLRGKPAPRVYAWNMGTYYSHFKKLFRPSHTHGGA